MALVRCEEILEHAEADQPALEAAEHHARWHGRLIRALRPYGDDSTSVGDALRWAPADLGGQADGGGFEALVPVWRAARSGLGTAWWATVSMTPTVAPTTNAGSPAPVPPTLDVCGRADKRASARACQLCL
jgi:hypothetical protein